MTVPESIESAFADVPYPGDDRIADHNNCAECDDVREHFRGATWRGHTIAELQEYLRGQSYVTLLADLDHSLHAHVVRQPATILAASQLLRQRISDRRSVAQRSEVRREAV